MDMFFKDNDSIMQVFAIQPTAETCQIFFEVPNPDKFKKKGLVALKLTEEGFTASNIGTHLVFLELTKNVSQLK